MRFQQWILICSTWLVLQAVSETSAAEFHVTPAGSPQGTGDRLAPWDLGTALVAIEKVKAGDTLWLHRGIYRGGYVSRLAGTAEQPVIIRAWPGDRVTIDTRPRDIKDDSLFSILGADAIYQDLEVMCSDPLRKTKFPGPWPEDIHRGNVNVRADRVTLANLILHDLDCGVGFWDKGEAGEISGCLIYNNGWSGPDRGHGHGIYAQNARGTKRIVDNIVFHQFGYGIHAYGSTKATLKGFEVSGNIAFENGCLTRKDDNAQGIMIGGECPAQGITVRDNIVVGGGIRLGYPWGSLNEDVLCTGNYCDRGLIIRDFRKASVTKNTVVAASTVVSLEGAENLVLTGHSWSENRYFLTDGRWGECSIVEHGKSRGMTYSEWQKQTGLDTGSQFTKGATSELRVVVRPNKYEAGRANIAILNPAGLPDVDVDLSSVLKTGQAFRIVSVKDFFGPPIATGVFADQPIKVSMKALNTPKPVGMPEVELPITEPQFGAFVVLSIQPSKADRDMVK